MVDFNELEFLRNSNNIENEWSDVALEDAVLAWEFLKNEEMLTTENILKTHQIGTRTRDTLDESEKGAYRKCAVWIGGQQAKPWYAVPALMDQWIVNANDIVINGKNEKKEFLERILKEQHVKFEAIHPFCDFNGRIGRILLNWQREKCNLPILILKEEEKFHYYKWFQTESSSTPTDPALIERIRKENPELYEK